MDVTILDAALVEISEHGIGGFSVVRVGQRAGVAKGSVRRRWPKREGLIIAALQRLGGIDPVDNGSIEKDLRALIDQLLAVESPEGMTLLHRFAADAVHYPVIFERFQDDVVAPVTATIVTTIKRAAARGEISCTIPPLLASQFLIGVLLTNVMQSRPPAAPSPHMRGQILRAMLEMLGDGHRGTE